MSQPRSRRTADEALGTYQPVAPPASFVTAARAAMGGIDIDPYTSKRNNSLIGARKILDMTKLSLEQVVNEDWGPFGKRRALIFAPFGVDANRRLLHKTLHEYRAGRIEQAVVLVSNSEIAAKCPWIWDFPVCIPFRRLRLRWYDDELDRFDSYTPSSWGFVTFLPPLEGEAYSSAINAFHSAFSGLGRIVFNDLSGDQSWRSNYRDLYRKDYCYTP